MLAPDSREGTVPLDGFRRVAFEAFEGVAVGLAAIALVATSGCASAGSRPAKGEAEAGLPAGATLTRDPASGTVRFLMGQNLSRELDADPVFTATRNAGDSEGVARAFLAAYAGIFRLDQPKDELVKTRIDVDKNGSTHVRFDQVYHSLPIPGAQLIVHLDRARRVVLVNGTYVPTPHGLDVAPALSADQARAAAERAGGLAPDACSACAADLVVFAQGRDTPRLAWRVAPPAGAIGASETTIDAHSGAVLRAIPAAPPSRRTDGEPAP